MGREFDKSYQTPLQQDVTEFIVRILHHFIDSIDKLTNKNKLKESFNLCKNETITCQNCSTKTTMKQNENTGLITVCLSPKIYNEKDVCLKTLINQYFNTSEMEKICSDECKSNQRHDTILTVSKMPEIFIAPIKRFYSIPVCDQKGEKVFVKNKEGKLIPLVKIQKNDAAIVIPEKFQFEKNTLYVLIFENMYKIGV